MDREIEVRKVSANGMDFTVLEQGAGELALCLHGFPDHPWSFRPLMGALAAVGFHAVAPFMRGYGPTGVPADGRYQTAVLAMDAVALIEALGAETAVVIGHDWGATAAYGAAVSAPHRVRRLITAAVPYGPGFITRLITDPVQQKRSWHMYLLSGPLGEAALSYDDFALIDRLWADWSPGFRLAPAAMAELKHSLTPKGAPLAAASYYKHTFLQELQDPALADLQARMRADPIRMKSLYLHGADDGCIGAEITTAASLYTAGVQSIVIPRAGHFLHVEQPELVNQTIIEFLAE